jgi:hypothetical protein
MKTLFQEKAQEHLDSMQELINTFMPDKGLKEEDSQKICLINALNNLEHYVNGVTNKDFEEEEEDE